MRQIAAILFTQLLALIDNILQLGTSLVRGQPLELRESNNNPGQRHFGPGEVCFEYAERRTGRGQIAICAKSFDER